MRIHIFDVEHGECSAIETPSGDLILIGVGHNSTTGWRPSTWCLERRQAPTCIVLTNLDRDHLSDIGNFEPHLRPQFIIRNQYIAPAWLAQKKLVESGEIHTSVQTAIHWSNNVYIGPSVPCSYGMELQTFFHAPSLFQDTNNLSVVTFTQYGGFGMLFTGDMERAGWEALLRNTNFIDCLRRTTVFVASHHGREGGYCTELFNYCRPQLTIISDKGIIHGTQEHDLYSCHCSGIFFGDSRRCVLTTRSDGKITIEIANNGRYNVWLNSAYRS